MYLIHSGKHFIITSFYSSHTTGTFGITQRTWLTHSKMYDCKNSIFSEILIKGRRVCALIRLLSHGSGLFLGRLFKMRRLSDGLGISLGADSRVMTLLRNKVVDSVAVFIEIVTGDMISPHLGPWTATSFVFLPEYDLAPRSLSCPFLLSLLTTCPPSRAGRFF